MHAGADIVGKTLGESGLERARHHRADPAPRHQRDPEPAHASVVLEAEDRLLCFGRLEEMRSMIPDRKQKRVRRLMKKHLPPESS